MTHTGRVLEMGHSAEQHFTSISFCPGNYNMNPQIPERHTQGLFNALSETVPALAFWKQGGAWTRLPLTTRGFGQSKSHGYHTVMNQTVLGSEKLKTDMVERNIYIYILRYMFTGFDIGLFHLLSTTQTQASQVVLTQFVLQVFGFYRKNCCGNSFTHSTWAWPHVL